MDNSDLLIYLWYFEVPRDFGKNTDFYVEPLLIDELLTYFWTYLLRTCFLQTNFHNLENQIDSNMFYLGCTVGNDYLFASLKIAQVKRILTLSNLLKSTFALLY